MKSRLERVKSDLASRGLDIFLTLTPENTQYLSGWRAQTYTRPIAAVIGAVDALIIPRLEVTHAEGRTAPLELVPYSDDDLGSGGGATALMLALQQCAELLNRHSEVRRAGFEPHALTVLAHRFLSEQVPIEWIACEPLVEQRRAIKDPEELELMRRAVALAEFDLMEQAGLSRPGISELEAQALGDSRTLAVAARRVPDSHAAVWSRPIAGPRSAEPHAMTSGRLMQYGDVIIYSCGIQLNGYWGGVERTMFLGRPSDAVRRYFDVALEAQRAGLAAIKPGVLCSQVDAAARRVIEAAQMGEYVLHRTGHGIGLLVHEFPSVARSIDAELRPGMVVSIEPGLYVPHVGGFRQEDNVQVTATGAQVVSTIPSDFESMILEPDHR